MCNFLKQIPVFSFNLSKFIFLQHQSLILVESVRFPLPIVGGRSDIFKALVVTILLFLQLPLFDAALAMPKCGLHNDKIINKNIKSSPIPNTLNDIIFVFFGSDVTLLHLFDVA